MATVIVKKTFPWKGDYHGAGKEMKLPDKFAKLMQRIGKVEIISKEKNQDEKEAKKGVKESEKGHSGRKKGEEEKQKDVEVTEGESGANSSQRTTPPRRRNYSTRNLTAE